MNVSMWMTRDLVTIGPEAMVAQAAGLMARQQVRRLLVIEKKGGEAHLVGIVSAKDILHAFPPEVNPFAVLSPDASQTRTLVGDIMNKTPQTTTPETPIEAAAALMREKKVGALVVMREKRLLGIITESDIFRAFVALFTTTEPGARITFDVSKGEDVFGLMVKLSQRRHVKVTSLIWTQQENQPVCVVRVVGQFVDRLLDDIWSSGHVVLNVIRFPHETPSAKPA